MKKVAALLFTALLAGEAREAHAWEAETTQAGLAEQAALSSRLHKRLVVLGFDGGLFEPLTVPPADAPALIETLHLLSPSHGAVPDARGRQTALAWIAAGASIADVPAKLGANHFYDPATKHGWQKPSRGMLGGLSDAVREAVGRAAVPSKGVPAIDWVTDKANPLNLTGFLDQYAKAVSSATPGERSRAMAGAWVQFAKTGNPNGASLPQWPAYAAPEYRVLEYGNVITIRSNADRPSVDFFQQVFQTMRRK